MWKMAAEGGGKEANDIKTHFSTREGVYKLLPNSGVQPTEPRAVQLAGLEPGQSLVRERERPVRERRGESVSMWAGSLLLHL